MRLELQAHLDEMLRRYRLLRDQLGDAQRQVEALHATAQSEDGMVSVTVDHQGDVVDLTLNPRVYRTMDTVTLSETIVAVTRTATGDVRQRAREIMAPLTPPDLGDVDVTGPAGGDLLAMLPADPTDLSRLRGSPR